MKLTIDFWDFEPWGSQARDAWERIENEDKLVALETMLEEIYPEGMSATALNDWLAYEPEDIYVNLGIYGELENIDERNIKVDFSDIEPDDTVYGEFNAETSVYLDVTADLEFYVDEDGIIESIDVSNILIASEHSDDFTDDFTDDIQEVVDAIYLGRKVV